MTTLTADQITRNLNTQDRVHQGRYTTAYGTRTRPRPIRGSFLENLTQELSEALTSTLVRYLLVGAALAAVPAYILARTTIALGA